MQHVIHHSVILTLEVVPLGVSKCTAEQATAAIVGEWLQAVGQQIERHVATSRAATDGAATHGAATHGAMPALQIYVRQLPHEQGAHVQILLCWVVLQAHHQELSEFDRSDERVK